jgi:hypothetical protein
MGSLAARRLNSNQLKPIPTRRDAPPERCSVPGRESLFWGGLLVQLKGAAFERKSPFAGPIPVHSTTR